MTDSRDPRRNGNRFGKLQVALELSRWTRLIVSTVVHWLTL